MTTLWTDDVEAPPRNSIKGVERIEDIRHFRALKDEWSGLLAESAADCFFLTWEWLFLWWTHLSRGRRLSLLTVRQRDRLSAIVPLALASPRAAELRPFCRLEFLGTGCVGSDYLDLIVRRGAEAETLRALTDYLCQQALPLELAQLRRNESTAGRLASNLNRLGWEVVETKTNVCPVIALSGHSWSSYLASLGPSHRYNFKRRLKQLNEQFRLRFEQLRSEEERSQALDLLLHLHNRRWSRRGGSNAFHTGDLASFHRELSCRALERGWLRLFVLWLDEKPAAALYGFLHNSRFLFYQSGFDPAFSKYGVGLVTMGLAIQAAVEEGAREYDLLHGAEKYKFLWANQVRELSCLELYPPGVRGRLYGDMARLGRASRRIARRLLPSSLASRIGAK